MSASAENTAIDKVRLLISENLPETWGLASEIIDENDFHFQIFSPNGLFGPKLLSEMNVRVPFPQNVTVRVVSANKHQTEIINDAYCELNSRLPKIPF